MDHVRAQLDRIELMQVAQTVTLGEQGKTIAKMWGEIEHLKRNAGVWGAVTAALVAVSTKLMGCL